MSDTTKTKDVLTDVHSKQKFAEMAQRIKELEDEIRVLEDGLSSVRLRAKNLALLATVHSLE